MLLSSSAPSNSFVEALTKVGFTELEAAVYVQLLVQAPATGYGIAKAIGKAAANVYQALGSLAFKGAVLADDDPSGRAFRATPPDELLSAMTAGYAADAEYAAASLRQLRSPAADDRIYTLWTAKQVLERGRTMIRGARDIILVDLFPQPAAALWPEIEAAHARGVMIAGLLYADPPATLSGANFVMNGSDFFLRRWPGQQMTVVVDAREQLTVLWNRQGDELRRAAWSDSAYLACLQHSGLAAEIRITAAEAEGHAPLPQLSLLRANPSGLRDLVGTAAEEGRGR